MASLSQVTSGNIREPGEATTSIHRDNHQESDRIVILSKYSPMATGQPPALLTCFHYL